MIYLVILTTIYGFLKYYYQKLVTPLFVGTLAALTATCIATLLNAPTWAETMASTTFVGLLFLVVELFWQDSK